MKSAKAIDYWDCNQIHNTMDWVSLTNQLAQSIICFWSVSDRVTVIQFCLSVKLIMTVSNVCGPTTIRVGANIEEHDKFICDLAKVTTAHRASTQFYITNDFNSKLSNHHQLKKTSWPQECQWL